MKKHISPRALIIALVGIGAVLAYLVLSNSSLTFSAAGEQRAMERLETTRLQFERSLFVTDGCSGNVSNGWSTVIESISGISESFASTYADARTIPFESACIEHDRAYHAGEGGYVGRLRADMRLRSDIVEYAIENTELIKTRTGIENDATAIHLYETIAETVYRGVRIGGAPCTGKPYAWGYGYDNGSCIEQ